MMWRTQVARTKEITPLKTNEYILTESGTGLISGNYFHYFFSNISSKLWNPKPFIKKLNWSRRLVCSTRGSGRKLSLFYGFWIWNDNTYLPGFGNICSYLYSHNPSAIWLMSINVICTITKTRQLFSIIIVHNKNE